MFGNGNAFGGRRKLNGAILGIAALLSVVAICISSLIIYGNNLDLDFLRTLTSTSDNVDRLRSASPHGRILRARARAMGGKTNTAVPDLDDAMGIPSEIPDVSATGPPILDHPPVAPYSFAEVLNTVPQFHDTFAVVVYDPPSDRFIAHYSTSMRWLSSCHKLITSFKILANSLRMLEPDRFNSNAPEFALALSSADYPGVRWDDCLRRQRSDCIYGGVELSPILHFGSSFRRPMFPTMVTLPMPQQNHLQCFHYWALHGVVCNYFLPRTPKNPQGLVFSEHIGDRGWDDLVPQVVWRGTDFSYLHKLDPSLRMPDFDRDVASRLDLSGKADERSAATHAMRQVYEELIPRWKAVVLTAEAEREAEALNEQNEKQGLERVVPWANMKFAAAMYMGTKTPVSEIEYYRQFEQYGIPAVGEGMSLEDLGQYRYHIDLGGGGGTTWSGTLEKLGLPGLLFHHVTPTKDYIHDKLVPWVHYVPVKADLSDLREKFLWAEFHPDLARRISDNATALARSLGTPEGFEAMFREFFEMPLRRVVEAYQPLERGADWREEMASSRVGILRPVIQCAGYYQHDCEKLVDDIDLRVHDRDPGMSRLQLGRH